ncbi:aspartic peptidase domain-containing protein [Aspergillus egyptiacus]|nr:aspartic peptidase domain-containing protein [Aspergillus egyptiacus]
MRLSQCLLFAAYLYSGASAFIPYRFKVKTAPQHSTSDSSSGSLDRRFVPYRLLSGNKAHVEDTSSSDDELISLDLKISHVRRDNQYVVALAEKPTSPGTVALHQEGLDYSYFSTVNIGTPGQPVWMMLDTGGANTWVFGSDCTAEPCRMHNTFGNGSSSTAEMTTDPFKVGYGSGNVTGVLATDHLRIGDIDVIMTFGVANNATDEFKDYPIDGILGLGRSETSMGKPAFMDLVAEQKQLESNVVGFHLSRSSDGARDGTVTFGGVDKTKFDGEIAYTDVAESSIHWNIPLDDASVDGRSLGFANKTAIIDTGTSYSLLPPKDAESLHALIPGSQRVSDENFALPCDSSVVVKFTFSGKSYSMPPRDYIGDPLESGGGCISTIIAEAVFGDDVLVLGDTFLKNVYTVFDFDNDRIGFAELPLPATKPATAPPAPTDTFAEEANSNPDPTETTSSPTTSSTKFTGTGTTTFSIPRYYWPAVAGLLYLSYF